ncbi:unnamed protein product, partial [Prorocentrum cordatum]
AKVNEDNVMHTPVMWATHGCAIYRCSAEQLRHELPGEAREREGRSEDPDGPLSTIEKLRRVLRRTKGTCNYRDLADTLDDVGEQHQPSAQALMQTDEIDGPTGAAAAAAPGDPQPATPGEDEGDGPAAASAGASGSAEQEPSRFHIEAMAKRSVGEAENLDGIPLVKRTRLSRAKLAPQSEEAALADEVGDEMSLLEESTETVHMLAFNRKEKDQFYAAKLGALEVFNRNDDWGPIDEADVDPAWGMKGGQKVASARVLYKGFKHRDVAEGQLDKEAPPLSGLGRRAVILWASLRKWRLFTADVKSAFLQAEDASVRGLKLRASLTKEMREMLSHQIGPQPGQLLKMIKPCFGDPRSPKLWHYRSDEVTREVGLRNCELKDCLLLFQHPAKVEDDPFDARSFEGQTYVLDGLIGEHVGDFIGCGEGVTNEQDLYANEKFKSGKWEFGPSLILAGGEVEQSLSTYSVTLNFEKYLHVVKPITVDKHWGADPTSALSPKELANFRALNGQLQWPATQRMIITTATVSFRISATGRATVQDVLGANKDLRFLKANGDVGLYFGFDKAWSDLRVGSYTDASWASRHDGNSQGGYAIFIGPVDELNAGTPTPFVAMEWASKKLQRLCRSSLSAEVQAAALGADSLMWVKVYLAWSLRPDLELEEAICVPWRCLYDASHSAKAGLGIEGEEDGHRGEDHERADDGE